MLPKALERVVQALGALPGVGARTAERYAYYLLRAPESKSRELHEALINLQSGVATCPVTFALIDSSEEVSPLYSDSSRSKQTVMVVEDPLDVIAIEKTRIFKGTYHVLGGAISPIDGVGPEQLHIPELVKRIVDDKVEELILATNASVEGESTALYLQKYIADANIKIKMSRLARGIPVGVDLEYADQITLSHALEGRQSITQ